MKRHTGEKAHVHDEDGCEDYSRDGQHPRETRKKRLALAHGAREVPNHGEVFYPGKGGKGGKHRGVTWEKRGKHGRVHTDI